MTKIALLSHRGGNIGHDFMAAGMEIALKEAFDDARIEHFEQHRHFEVYPEGHWLRFMHKVPHGRLRLLRQVLYGPTARTQLWRQTKPLDYDLAVACGGPNIVPHANISSEMGLMLHHMNGAFYYRGVPFVDAGVGASFPLEHVPERIENNTDRAFYTTAFGFCRTITVRDRLAEKLVRDLGFNPALIPCGALCAGRLFESCPAGGVKQNDHIVINFQRLGSNTDWGQGINAAEWLRTMQAIIAHFEKRHPVLLLAHNAYEKKLAAQLAPQHPCHMPVTLEAYAQTIRQAKIGLVSRIHAAIPMAGIGAPSLVIGTDTRLGTVEQMGLKTVYVKHASTAWIIEQAEALIERAGVEKERLIALREDTIKRYAALYRNSVRKNL